MFSLGNIFTITESWIVLDTLIDLALNLNTRYSLWPLRTRIIYTPPRSFKTFRPFLHFSWVRSVIVKMSNYPFYV
jgi:hypothetical protein